jgi:ABC-type amino acid transport substrate-binding protein
MAKRKVKADDPEHDWTPSAEYLAMQLTPEESAELRAEMQKDIDRAARDGVYDKLLALRGKVHLDLEALRRDRDDW